MSPPMAKNKQGRNRLSTEENSNHQKPELNAQDVENGSTISRPVNSDTKMPNSPAVDDGNVKSSYERAAAPQASTKKSSKSVRKENKVPANLRSRRYLLRSSLGSGRVLRSMSNGPNKTPPLSSTNPTNIVKEKRNKRRKVKRASNDEYSRARQHVRYMLTRMNYEQSLIDAYSGEGWKGQSSEKIKPEKELQRAQSEIIRCKLKIRDMFRHLDSLMSEGRLEDSLFDSEGEIDSEDICCAKCGSKDLSADNDIILCDGICNRGFHQKCLNPPLLNDNIPSGDEGWLCPGCDCKIDCLELLNEFHGTDLSIEDNWEKVFPEAAASATGDKQYDDFGLPSDDSEDEDYDPDSPRVDGEVEKEGLSSEESDSSSSSNDSRASNHDQHYEDFGFPSDDSEDNDYDPNNPDVDDKVQEDGSDSDEPEFTSDSVDSLAPINDPSEADEASISPLISNFSTPVPLSGKGRYTRAKSKPSINSELLSSMEPDMGLENAVPLSGKRQCDRLDYKNLHDDTYGSISTDSSDDEDWTDMSTPKKVKNDAVENDSVGLPKGNVRTIENAESSKSIRGKPSGCGAVHKPKLDKTQVPPAVSWKSSNCTKGKLPGVGVVPDPKVDQSQVSPELTGNSSHGRTRRKLQPRVASHSMDKHNKDCLEPDSNGNRADTSARRSFGIAISQKLRDNFKENQYPSRDKRESLAKELGITPEQVSKWFGNARHSFRVSAKEASQAGVSSPGNATIPNKTSRKDSKSDMAMGSKNSTSNEGQENEPVRAGSIEVGSTERGISEGERKNEVVEESERQKLVMRELRKRRRIK